jgi:hypothetical protein
MALHLVVEISVSRRQAGAEGPMAEEGQTKCFLWSSPWNERRIMSNLSGPQVSQHSGDAADFVIARGRLLVAANLPRQVERDDVRASSRDKLLISPTASHKSHKLESVWNGADCRAGCHHIGSCEPVGTWGISRHVETVWPAGISLMTVDSCRKPQVTCVVSSIVLLPVSPVFLSCCFSPTITDFERFVLNSVVLPSRVLASCVSDVTRRRSLNGTYELRSVNLEPGSFCFYTSLELAGGCSALRCGCARVAVPKPPPEQRS